MIEIFGVKVGLEAALFLSAFILSEVIGESKLKESSVFGVVKNLIDSFKDSRTEDEKVEEVKESVQEVIDSLKKLGE